MILKLIVSIQEWSFYFFSIGVIRKIIHLSLFPYSLQASKSCYYSKPKRHKWSLATFINIIEAVI